MMQQNRDLVVQTYLLYLVDITLFTNNSATYVDVAYLKYVCDLELVSNYAWGEVDLAHLYLELNNECHFEINNLAGYKTLLQV